LRVKIRAKSPKAYKHRKELYPNVNGKRSVDYNTRFIILPNNATK